ncbi:MAG: DUF3078 domain-containing protein [Bacteroidales bacterium]|nr:DUF3078 domain-containing protein [Bacteroidales bacterium]
MRRIFLTLCGLTALFGVVRAQDDAQQAAAEAAAALAGAPKEEAPAPKPKYWKTSTVLDLGVNQTKLFNWAAGGFDNITLSAGLDAKAYYEKERTTWKNRLQLEYGFIWSEDKSYILQKSNDRIYLESKFSYKTSSEKWNWTASYDFRSQFTDSYSNYDYPDRWYEEYGKDAQADPHMQQELEQMKAAWQEEFEAWRTASIKSTFLSPAYNNIAFGVEWKPTSWFDLNLSPLTGSVIIVTEPVLRQQYGMPANPNSVDVYPYYSFLFQFGASLKSNAKFSINDKFNYETQVVVFTDYLNHPFTQYRVNWDNKIAWQITSFFKVGLSTWLLYDPIVEIDGVKSKVQFKDFLAFNFTFAFGQKDLK